MSAEESVEVLSIGGGICGVLAGQRCAAKGLSFRIVDEGIDFGGSWSSLANTHSQSQVGQVSCCTKTLTFAQRHICLRKDMSCSVLESRVRLGLCIPLYDLLKMPFL